MPGRLTRLKDIYLGADPRSLAVGRIALALVLLFDLAKRAAELDLWYTNDGVLPNHTLLWSPTFRWVFSFFYMASWWHEAAFGFLVCGVCYLALLVGYRTRLAQVASFLCVLSLHGRVLFIQNGGDVVLGELAFWTMFLPSGRRYSVDALRAGLRARKDERPEDLAERQPRDTRPVVSLAAFVLLLQLAVIYAFNAVHKNGPAWRDGSVVHFVLHQDRIVTTLGLFIRTHLPVFGSHLFTWSALVIEGLLPVLLISPVAVRGCRRLAVLLIIALHVGFALMLNLGVFVPAMIAFGLHFIPAGDLDALERWWARRRRARVVIFDEDCGFCFQVVRALAFIDRAQHLRFVGNGADPLPVPDLSRELCERTIVVFDPASGRRWVRADAFAQIARSLPGGAPIGWLLRLPGLRAIANWGYDRVAAHRTQISQALGLAACGIKTPAGTTRAIPAPAPTGREGTTFVLREVLVALAMALATSQALAENAAIPRWLRPPAVEWREAAVQYLQLFQGWSMFAPDAPRDDMNIYVDAVTSDGRHVDPWNEVATPRYPDVGAHLPPRLDQSSFVCDSVTRIPYRPAYHQAFQDWILRYPQRTHRRRDTIVSFIAYTVEDDSPAPGQLPSGQVRTRPFLEYTRRE